MPSLSLDTYYEHNRQEIVETDVSVYGEGLARYPSKGITLTLTQPVLRIPSIMRLSQAREEVKGADFEFQAAEQDLIMRVVESYIKALEAYDNLEFTQSEEEAVKLGL